MTRILSKLTRRGFIKGAAESTAAMAVLGRVPTAAPANAETYKLTREIPVERGYDIIVAGGGPSGAAAAISAARLGAKVLLIEAIGSMGGMGTNALVSWWFSLNNGEEVMIGGLIMELIQKLYKAKQVNPDVAADIEKGRLLDAVGFNPEGLKILLDQLCHESGVEVRYFTRVIDVDVDRAAGRVKGVVTNNIEGYRYITAKAFID